MNDTSSSPLAEGMLSSRKMGGFGYGIAVSVGVLVLFTTITLTSYFCTRVNSNQRSAVPGRAPPDETDDGDVEAGPGLDEATLMSYPKLLYSEAKVRGKDGSSANSSMACCSICLADYKNTDMLRLLPDCGHLFHLKCVDPWLRLHPTCPVCRTSPLPTPLPTPLAEVVPLARQIT